MHVMTKSIRTAEFGIQMYKGLVFNLAQHPTHSSDFILQKTLNSLPMRIDGKEVQKIMSNSRAAYKNEEINYRIQNYSREDL